MGSVRLNRLVFALALVHSGALLLGEGPAQADCANPFGKPNEVLDFHVKMKRADWDLLRGFSPKQDLCDAGFPNYKAEFRCGDVEPWLKVAIHKKRGSDAPMQKPSLKIDFNDDFMGAVPEAKGQSWPPQMGKLGYRKLTLNNGQANLPPAAFGTFLLPVLLKEEVGMRLVHREIPLSPGAAYAKLFIHFDGEPAAEYHGVFVLLEDIDRSALRRRIGSFYPDGKMTKQTNALCAAEVQFDDPAPNPAREAFDAWMKKDPKAFAGTWLAETQKAMELDWLLRQEAVREIILNGTDTILNNANNEGANPGLGNNYYAFDPLVGSKRQYIPWDVDGAFGHAYDLCQPTAFKCAPTIKVLKQCDPLPPMGRFSVLGQRTVCHPEIQPRYLATMCQLINGSLSANEMIKVWDDADKAVRPVIPLEAAFIWGGKDPLSLTSNVSYGAEYARIKSWIPLRIASIRDQLKARGVVCPDACTEGASESCGLFDCQGQRRCTNGLWTPCVLPSTCKYMSMSTTPDAGAKPDDASAAGRDGGTGAVASARDGGIGGADPGVGGSGGMPGPGGAGTAPGVGSGGTKAVARLDAKADPGGPSNDPGAGTDAKGGCACAVGSRSRPSAFGIVTLMVVACLIRRPGRRTGGKAS